MPRRSISPIGEKDQQPHVIVENALYSGEQVQRLLHLKPSSLRTAKREGLVFIRRFARDWFLGSDLLAWLRAGRCSRPLSKMVEGSASSLDLNSEVQ